jgi:hypothetical protein
MTERRTFTGRLIAAGPTRTLTGGPGRYVVTAEAIRAAVDEGLFRGLACFADHAPDRQPSVRRLVGVWDEVAWDAASGAAVGHLRAYETAGTGPVLDLVEQWLADQSAGRRDGPDLGVSLVFYPGPAPDGRTIARIEMVESADLVMFPASDGARIVGKGERPLTPPRSRPRGEQTDRGAVTALASWSAGYASHSDYREREMGSMTQETDTMEKVAMQRKEETGASASGGDAVKAANGATGAVAPWGRGGITDEWVEALQTAAAVAIIASSGLPVTVQQRLRESRYDTAGAVYEAVEQAQGEVAALKEAGVVKLGGRPPRANGHGGAIRLGDPLDEARDLVGFFFGAAGASPPPPNLRNFADLYVALTGDVHFRGVFDGSRVQFSGATTTTLANLAVDAMNKVIVQQFQTLDHYRWFERIASVEPNDGRLHDMKWITLGGIGNLPTVSEGAAYTELSVADVQETAAFVKRGGYIGITREMIKNSDIMQLQAIPRALAVAAVRTRSAAVAALFTANSGVGPTLSQDSKALFHGDHSNLVMTALGTDAAAWRAARQECFKHAEVNSGKVLGIFPRFLLVPAELYDTALSILGYGEGMPTVYTPEAQDRGFADPRPVPLVVPDWTDANDWGYIVDPAVYPVIQMSYSQSPGGRRHPTPELFAVVSETSGLMFTNDTLPIKVRDEFALGVNGHRGIGKRNVA